MFYNCPPPRLFVQCHIFRLISSAKLRRRRLFCRCVVSRASCCDCDNPYSLTPSLIHSKSFNDSSPPIALSPQNIMVSLSVDSFSRDESRHATLYETQGFTNRLWLNMNFCPILPFHIAFVQNCSCTSTAKEKWHMKSSIYLLLSVPGFDVKGQFQCFLQSKGGEIQA